MVHDIKKGSALAKLLPGFDDYSTEGMNPWEAKGAALLNNSPGVKLSDLREHHKCAAAIEALTG